ncbi:three-Cys-motif partner protein TcmP [Aquihabitans daechungensis]|uniref:three-Cys-motif partner protein TcmP n=1 Tax=Aquihabitans daechungensis TaxID=1052257 RepID=UPI003BA1E309
MAKSGISSLSGWQADRMAAPTGVLWERDPHTEAKHTLLRRYLSAWFPIMARKFRSEGITFLDGFAGPGEYTNSAESSPTIALRQALRDDVVQCGSDTRLVFIEEQKGRAEHLRALLDARFPQAQRPRRCTTEVVHGKCGNHYSSSIDKLGGWRGPIFANLDGWGADTDYEIVERIAKQQSSEVLVTFQDQFFIRFAAGEQESGERVFGHSRWRQVDQLPTNEKQPFLLALYRQGLHDAGFTHVLTFEMVDERGHSLHLFFGTTSVVAVEKFKEGLWEVDGFAGQRFRDPRDPNQLTFDILEPDFTPLANIVMDLLQERERTMEELCQYALLETIYKPTHVKPVVDRLRDQRRVEIPITGRSFADKVVCLAPDTLFG